MYLKILSHPIFLNLNFHMPMIVDLSHPLIMLEGENGSGKSTLLHSIYLAMREEQVESYAYKLDKKNVELGKVLLFDAEQHNPRNNPELFNDDPQMKEFIMSASHGQVMLSLFRETFPSLPDGSVLLLDEPEMALSQSNQRRILKMLKELVDQKNFRIKVRRDRKGETHTHTARIALDGCIDEFLDSGKFHNRIKSTVNFRFAHAENCPIQKDIFTAGQLRVKASTDF